MKENTENLVVEQLRAMRSEISALGDDVGELNTRLGNVETGLAGVRTELDHVHSVLAEQSVRVDRLADRMGRIEQRLDLMS